MSLYRIHYSLWPGRANLLACAIQDFGMASLTIDLIEDAFPRRISLTDGVMIVEEDGVCAATLNIVRAVENVTPNPLAFDVMDAVVLAAPGVGSVVKTKVGPEGVGPGRDAKAGPAYIRKVGGVFPFGLVGILDVGVLG